jgi:hypothetical protein
VKQLPPVVPEFPPVVDVPVELLAAQACPPPSAASQAPEQQSLGTRQLAPPARQLPPDPPVLAVPVEPPPVPVAVAMPGPWQALSASQTALLQQPWAALHQSPGAPHCAVRRQRSMTGSQKPPEQQSTSAVQ